MKRLRWQSVVEDDLLSRLIGKRITVARVIEDGMLYVETEAGDRLLMGVVDGSLAIALVVSEVGE